MGVSLRRNPKRKGLSAWAWVAYWSDAIGQQKRSFSLATYGFDEALIQAIQRRERATGILISQQQALEASERGRAKMAEFAVTS